MHTVLELIKYFNEKREGIIMGDLFITIFLGWAGVHKFIKKQTGMGILYLLTFGLFGIGWIIDIVKEIADLNLVSASSVNSSHNTELTSNIESKSLQLVFSNDFMIVGAQYECRKNKHKMRHAVIAKMKPNMQVNIEKYSYKGSPAYMIVDPKTHLDLGVLSQGAADWISRDYPNAKIEGILTERHNDTFKVKINVYQ